MNDKENTPILTGCMTAWLFSLYIVGVMIVGQVAWKETGILWDSIRDALFWPITAAVMVAAGQ